MPDEVEPLHRLRVVEHLVVAVAPAEAREVVAHPRRGVAHGPILLDPERAVALGQLRAVGPVDQRDVREERPRPAHRVVDQRLPRGVGQVVVAADHVGDAHVVVVHHHGQHVGRRPVRAQQHHVVELIVGRHHAALHGVLHHGLALARGAQPDHGRRVGVLRRRDVAPGGAEQRRAPLGPGLLARGFDLLGRGEAAKGRPGVEHRARDLGVAVRPGELAHRLAVPVEPEPFEPPEDRRRRLLRGPGPVGVLDPKEEPAAPAARVEPVEERRARPSDVQEPGGRGREAGDGRLWHVGGGNLISTGRSQRRRPVASGAGRRQ